MSYEKKALDIIKASYGTVVGEYSIDEFVSHHIDELPQSYWQDQLKTDNPTPEQVISLLVLRSKWDDEEVYDFTLPNDVTDYVVSVTLDESGEFEDITMES
jgi:hypothetical protein